MSELRSKTFQLPPEQQAIRDKCFHPSATFVEFPIDDVESSIPAQFEKVAQKYPARAALVEADRHLTYEELNREANRLAWRVIDAIGTGNAAVLLACEHGVDAIVGALAILKAGKTLVAVDPSFPLEQVGHIADDSQAAALITTEAAASLVVGLATPERPLIGSNLSNARSKSDNPTVSLSGQSAAQIVYTSGSTGRPKGVLRNHARMIYSASLLINAMHIESRDRLLILYSLSFGAGLTEILKGLLAGASLFPFDVRTEGLSKLSQFLNDRQITYFSSSPSCFRHFADDLPGAESFPSVRLVELGSEALLRRDVQLFREHFGSHAILVNRFASSETATVCLYYVDATTVIDGPIVPVGYAVAGKSVSILDEQGHPVENGCPGEIAVQSSYLSTGYWNNSSLTTEKFLTQNQNRTAPIYLTGDLGRFLLDGRLVYLGRKDDQVKIRGHRIEPGATEALLSEHPAVKRTVVIAREDHPGNQQMVAYVVLRPECTTKSAKLREYLRARFPESMVPSMFVYLDDLPLTPSGKVERRALPAPDLSRSELEYRPPRNPTEEKLSIIWAEVLRIDRVGIDDDFFGLGGHSLAASRVIARVIKAFKRDIPLKALFDAPTVAQMAEVIDLHQGKSIDSEELARLLDEVEAMSEEEAQLLLAKG